MVIMPTRKSKEVRLEELKTNLKICVFGVQEWVKRYGTASFEDESSFKKFRRGLDEIINSSFTFNTGLSTPEAENNLDISHTTLDHIYSRGCVAEYILKEAIWPSAEVATPLDKIIDRDAYLWVSVARITVEQNKELRNCIISNEMKYFDTYEMKHYKELDLTLRYNDVTIINNENTDQGYSKCGNDVEDFPEIIYACEIPSVVENMTEVPFVSELLSPDHLPFLTRQ